MRLRGRENLVGHMLSGGGDPFDSPSSGQQAAGPSVPGDAAATASRPAGNEGTRDG